MNRRGKKQSTNSYANNPSRLASTKHGRKRKKASTGNVFSDFLSPREREEEIEIFSSSSSEGDESHESYHHQQNWERKIFNQNIRQFRDLRDTEELEKEEEDEDIALNSDNSDIHEVDCVNENSDVEIEDYFGDTQTQRSRKNETIIKEYISEDEVKEITKQSRKLEDDQIVSLPTQSTADDIQTQRSIEDITPSQQQQLIPIELQETESQAIECDCIDDSNSQLISPIRRKTKAVKGGLAERVQTLQRRQQSDNTFWKHNTQVHIPVNALQVEVKSIRNEYSINSIVCSLNNDVDIIIIIPDHLFNDLKITLKSKLHIYQPWKQIYMKEIEAIVLLCAHRIIVCPSGTTLDWTKQNQDMLEFYKKQLLENLEKEPNNNVEPDLPENVAHSNDILTTSTVRSALQQHGYCKPLKLKGRVQRVFIERLAESSLSQETSSLSAKKNKESETMIRLKLWLQDDDNELSEIHVICEIEDERSLTFLSLTEGKYVEISNLNFIKNLSYRRLASLKSMMQLFTNVDDSQNSLNSQSSSSQTSVFLKESKQLHVFSIETEDVKKDIQVLNDHCGILHRPPLTISNDIQSSRVSFDVRIITIINTSTNNSSSLCAILKMSNCCVYVSNLGGNVSKLYLNCCFVPENILSAVQNVDLDSVCINLKDVRYDAKEGAYFVDAYSRMYLLSPQTPQNQFEEVFVRQSCSVLLLKKANIQIPSINADSKVNDLLVVTGRICGIDEKTALFWKSCTFCGNSNIIRIRNSDTCEDCGKEANCDIQIQLDVFLYIPMITPSICILCKLTEKTLSLLLPKQNINEQDFQGFDLKGILGKKLTKKLFIVVGLDDNYGAKKSKLFFLKECISLI